MSKEAVRFLGHCQICEAEQKLHKGNLVHHGYRRPGWGSIIDDCFGVGALPYEKSCELCKTYKESVQSHLDSTQDYLARLETGKVLVIVERSRRDDSLTEYAAGVTEYWKWTGVLESRIGEQRYLISQLTREIARITRRITDWKLSDVEQRTEAVRDAEVRAAADARKATRDAARKAREDKAAALKAKREARAAEQKVVRDGFFDKFRALAEKASTDEKAAKNEAFALAQELTKNKYKSAISYYDLKEIDAALITLGLAWRRDTYVNYASILLR